MKLELRNVSKRFPGVLAVDDVSFSVPSGAITGYLGPNGSGKSTTMKMIAGLLEIGSGEILFDGQSIRRDLIAHKQRMGYVPEEPHLYAHLSGPPRRTGERCSTIPTCSCSTSLSGLDVATALFLRRLIEELAARPRPGTSTPSPERAASVRPPAICSRISKRSLTRSARLRSQARLGGRRDDERLARRVLSFRCWACTSCSGCQGSRR